MYNLTFFKWDGLNEWLTPICSDCLIIKKSPMYCTCVRLCVCVLRIVSRDKILRFKNNYLIYLNKSSSSFESERHPGRRDM